jgi:LacI family transcriptional regulator
MPTPRFTIREIAREAGVSDATVDRVVHERGGVRASTAAAVRRAIVDLERHRDAFELGGRSFTLDLVIHSPRRFSSAVWDAFDRCRSDLRPANIRIRAHTSEHFTPEHLARTLDEIRARGSHGVIVKAPDVPIVHEAVKRLADASIPVLTIVTDLPGSRRLAYVGIDNRSAGATAAYLIRQWLPPRSTPPTVLLTVSDSRFQGEEERGAGFRDTASTLGPDWRLVDLTETGGLDRTVAAQIAALDADVEVDAVYSMGGANTATLQALARRHGGPQVYIAHDLDADNRTLLRDGAIAAILHHDLRADARRACGLVMQAQGAIPGTPTTEVAPVQILTPFNLPAAAT